MAVRDVSSEQLTDIYLDPGMQAPFMGSMIAAAGEAIASRRVEAKVHAEIVGGSLATRHADHAVSIAALNTKGEYDGGPQYRVRSDYSDGRTLCDVADNERGMFERLYWGDSFVWRTPLPVRQVDGAHAFKGDPVEAAVMMAGRVRAITQRIAAQPTPLPWEVMGHKPRRRAKLLMESARFMPELGRVLTAIGSLAALGRFQNSDMVAVRADVALGVGSPDAERNAPIAGGDHRLSLHVQNNEHRRSAHLDVTFAPVLGERAAGRLLYVAASLEETDGTGTGPSRSTKQSLQYYNKQTCILERRWTADNPDNPNYLPLRIVESPTVLTDMTERVLQLVRES